MTPTELVDRFVTLTSECLDQMHAEFGGLDRLSVYASAEFRPRDGSAPKTSGRVGSDISFQVHGVGCRFELDSGVTVDVDWDSEGRAVFDTWRMYYYADSIGERNVDRAALLAAAMANSQLTPLDRGFFTWADGRHRMEYPTRP